MAQRRADMPIVVLAGATCVGKTRVAVELCRRIGGEIVGADSVQVYRGLDVGSGKPTPQELSGVQHHLIDVLEPTEAIDAARYAALADAAIDAVSSRGGVPVIVGGTGLWLRALLRGLLPLPAVDPELRTSLEREWDALGAEPMHARLRKLDPLAADAVHPSDRLRVVRALEVHAQTGRPLGELRAQHALGTPRYRALTLVLDMELEAWRAAVAKRAASMLAAGLVNEVRGLLDRHGPELLALRSVGYRQVVVGLGQGATPDEIERQIVRATLLYGRRQRNWFRSEPGVDARLPVSALLEPERIALIRTHVGR